MASRGIMSAWMKSADFKLFENQLRLLWYLGHVNGYETYEDAKHGIKNARHQAFTDAVDSYQSYSLANGVALARDGDFGYLTSQSVAQRFCACPDIRRAGGQSKWSFTNLNVWWRGPATLGFSDVKARWLAAVSRWGEFTPLTYRWWTDSDGSKGPNVYCDTQRIDGQNQVLAYMYLPSANAPRTEKNQMVIDTAENWQQNDWFFPRVVEHEAGHAIGLDHIPNQGANKALMNPYIQSLDGPQQLDIAAAQRLYGAKPTDPGPGPDPEPPPTPGSELVGKDPLGKLKDGRTLFVSYTIE